MNTTKTDAEVMAETTKGSYNEQIDSRAGGKGRIGCSFFKGYKYTNIAMSFVNKKKAMFPGAEPHFRACRSSISEVHWGRTNGRRSDSLPQVPQKRHFLWQDRITGGGIFKMASQLTVASGRACAWRRITPTRAELGPREVEVWAGRREC